MKVNLDIDELYFLLTYWLIIIKYKKFIGLLYEIIFLFRSNFLKIYKLILKASNFHPLSIDLPSSIKFPHLYYYLRYYKKYKYQNLLILKMTEIFFTQSTTCIILIIVLEM